MFSLPEHAFEALLVRQRSPVGQLQAPRVAPPIVISVRRYGDFPAPTVTAFLDSRSRRSKLRLLVLVLITGSTSASAIGERRRGRRKPAFVCPGRRICKQKLVRGKTSVK